MDSRSDEALPADAGQLGRGVSRGSKAIKHCHRCGTAKPLEAFGLNRSTKDGRQSQCNKCRQQWRADNRARIAEKDRAYRDAKGKALLQKKREYYARTRETQREQKKKYRKAFFASNPNYNKEYYLKHKKRLDAKAANSKQVERLTNAYVASVMGLPTRKVPRELLDMKREQLLTLRLARALKKATHESSKDTR